MKFLKNYLKNKIYFIIAYLVAIGIFVFTLNLYNTDFEKLFYPFSLSLLVLLVFLIYDYLKAYKRYQEVLSYLNDCDDLMECDDLEINLLIERLESLKRELKNLKSKKISDEKDLIDFYMTWVHQIKVPISALKLLLDDQGEMALMAELLKIEQYVNMILNAVRLNDNSSDLVIEEVDLDEVIQNVISAYASIFILKHLSIDFQKTEAKVLSDKKWLSFVIEQIISNALKYTKTGGITISFKDDVLKISDTGIGISSDDLKRAFEKGYTGKVGRSEMQATGLGLYLSKKILDHLGHEIKLESTLKVGTTVTIDLSHKEIFD